MDATRTETTDTSNGTAIRGSSRGPVPVRVLRWSMNALYGALAAALPSYAVFRILIDHKARSRWRAYLRDVPERFGRRRPRSARRPSVWIHGVSVGEVKAAATLVDVIERRVPGVEILISVTTDTGRRVARKHYPFHRIEYYPPDLSWIVGNALDALRPDLMILVESELWPNFLLAARERNVPVALVNGRMSARSADRFRALRSVTRPLFSSLDRVCVQVPLYAERFADAGIDPTRIHVTGNMKFDNIPLVPDSDRLQRFREMLGATGRLPTVVVGSTHPGEERALVRIRSRLLAEGLAHRMVVAPRHPGRADAVAHAIEREGQTVVRRSALESTPGRVPDAAVVLLDTVGELEVVYALADAVFVGGTLVPHGGQNVMEPASLGKPVVVGPHVHNFRGEVDMLRHAGGLVMAADASGVEGVLRRWLTHPEEARAIGERACAVINASKGATQRTAEILEPLLDRIRRVNAGES